MKGENDEGERSIDGMTVWAEHLYHLQQDIQDVPKNVHYENILLKLFLLIFKTKILFSKV